MKRDFEGFKKALEKIGAKVEKNPETKKVLAEFSKDNALKIELVQEKFAWIIVYDNKKINPEEFNYSLLGTNTSYTKIIFT